MPIIDIRHDTTVTERERVIFDDSGDYLYYDDNACIIKLCVEGVDNDLTDIPIAGTVNDVKNFCSAMMFLSNKYNR